MLFDLINDSLKPTSYYKRYRLRGGIRRGGSVKIIPAQVPIELQWTSCQNVNITAEPALQNTAAAANIGTMIDEKRTTQNVMFYAQIGL